MKTSHFFLIAFGLCFNASIFSQGSDKLWSATAETNIRLTGARQIVPQKFLTYSLQQDDLKNILFSAPHENKVTVNASNCIISLPLPNGTIQKFRVIESPMMAPELSAAFPDIKTFSVKGIDDPYASGKLDWNEFGFHGMIHSIHGDFFIDPYCVGNTKDYISYYTLDFEKAPEHKISEGVLELSPSGDKKKLPPFKAQASGKLSNSAPAICIGSQLRTYRLAVACTGEYAKAATGLAAPTVTQALAKIVTSVNRVNGVYEKEVSVRLTLIANEALIVFTDPTTDPFNGNFNGNSLINESQTVITATIGTANFDIGHTFSTGGGGLANLGCVCSNANKARGITGSSSPVGDPYDIDYVAHEMGHQFDGNHTFNAITGSCSGNREASTSVEPGSGVTIMGYAGICSSNNLSNHSIANFHAISYDEIVNFLMTGGGSACGVASGTGNNPPVVTGSGNYIIPKGTPFTLTGSATDPDGDALTYSWEEMDAGITSGNWNSGQMPFFRSYAPVATPTRLFPRNSIVINGNYTGTMGEYVPQSAQVLNFRLTARDNNPNGGGVCYASSNVTIDDAGPLTVTYPSATGIAWPISSSKVISWDVNGTSQPPVSCDSVRVWISYDGGQTYTILVNTTPNDGIETITVPTLTATINTCRIKIESIGNVFYDISNNNFIISTDPTVGLKQVSLNNPVALSAWPNPFSNKIDLTAGNLNSSSPVVVSVVDMLGKTLLKFSYSSRSELKESLDLSDLSNGVYFIKINNDNKSSVHRIVKN